MTEEAVVMYQNVRSLIPNWENDPPRLDEIFELMVAPIWGNALLDRDLFAVCERFITDDRFSTAVRYAALRHIDRIMGERTPDAESPEEAIAAYLMDVGMRE